jgi:two-component system cell cycle sensor histidine kinase/response regulator CckA
MKFEGALNDLRASNRRLSALIELTLQLTSELDVRRLLQSASHGTREILGARHSLIGILDPDGARFQFLFTSGMSAQVAAQLGSPDPKTAVLQPILQKGRCVRLSSRGGDPVGLGFSASHPPTHSWLGAPIASPTRVYGYLGLINKTGPDERSEPESSEPEFSDREFSEEDEHLAGSLSAQVGRLYQNAKLYSEVLTHAGDLERKIAARPNGEA